MNQDAFLDAWRRGISIAGPKWFGDGTGVGATKWKLEPRYDDIASAIGWLSSGESAFLVAMYSFYNADTGGELMRKLGIGGLADVAGRLDGPRRKVIADLLVSYEGW